MFIAYGAMAVKIGRQFSCRLAKIYPRYVRIAYLASVQRIFIAGIRISALIRKQPPDLRAGVVFRIYFAKTCHDYLTSNRRTDRLWR